MEKEIEKLKQEYLKTPIPKSLEQKGFSDVLSRILQTNGKPHQFYYSQLVGVVILAILLFTGFVSFAQASKPGTPLYPVKKLTAEVISKVTGKTPEDVEKEISTFLDIKNFTATPTPSTQVTPTIITSPNNNEEKESEKLDENETETRNETKTDDSIEKVEILREKEEKESRNKKNEEVKGESTTKESNNQENKQETDKED